MRADRESGPMQLINRIRKKRALSECFMIRWVMVVSFHTEPKGDPFSRGPRKVNVARFVGGLGLIVLAYVRSGDSKSSLETMGGDFSLVFQKESANPALAKQRNSLRHAVN
jgi:hypothetical protein